MQQVPENLSLRDELTHLDMNSLRKRLIDANPLVHNTTDLLDRRRLIRAIEIAEYAILNDAHSNETAAPVPVIKPLVFGIQWERATLRRRITERLQQRLHAGMVDEVERLHRRGIPWGKFDYWGLEYRYVSLYIQGKITYEQMFRDLNTKIHQYAKRQETWFRRMERRGLVIHWLEGDDYRRLKEKLGILIDEISAKL
jgi:tRNA dimethylallyltransferase